MGNTVAPFRMRELDPLRKHNVLNGSPSLESLATKLRNAQVTNVVVLCGAGISVAAGVPDFRSQHTGLYDNLSKYKLPHPTAIFDLGFFRRDPRPFFSLARELYPRSRAHSPQPSAHGHPTGAAADAERQQAGIVPTFAHYLMVLLHSKGLLRRVYSQNIDMLETVAGLPRDTLVECHGSFASSTCMGCARRYDTSWMEEKLFSSTAPPSSDPLDVPIPACDVCGAVVKPDITFFGESLPERYSRCLQADLAAADCLLVLGTSLQVYPVASIPRMVGPYVPRVLFNREAVGLAPPQVGPQGGADSRRSVDKEHRDRSSTGGTDVHMPLPSDAEDAFLTEAIRNLDLDKASAASDKHVPGRHQGSEQGKEDSSDEEDLYDDLTGEGSWGFRFHHRDNYRDIFVQGDIEEGVQALALACGWAEELTALVHDGRKRILQDRLGKPSPLSDSALQSHGSLSLLPAQADAALAGSPLPHGRVDMAPLTTHRQGLERPGVEGGADLAHVASSMSVQGILSTTGGDGATLAATQNETRLAGGMPAASVGGSSTTSNDVRPMPAVPSILDDALEGW